MSKKRKCGREWRWRTSGKVNWEGYREKGEEKMDLFAKDVMSNPGVGGLQRIGIKFFRVILMKQLGSFWVNDFGQ